MSKGYWFCAYRSIKDPNVLVRYSKLATPVVLAAGGRFLFRGVAEEVREAGVKDRTVVIEFETLELAVATYESKGYQEAIAVLADAAERDFRIVKALD